MTHYETLGVARNASPAEIKVAFRKLASKHHPDRGGDKETAAAINDAYACLSDSERRAQYDAGGAGHAGPTPEELLRQRAMQILAQAFEDAANVTHVETTGVLREVTDTLQKAAAEISQKAATARQTARRWERIKGKLVRKQDAGDDILAMLLDGKANQALSVARNADDGVAQMRAALAILEDYELEPVKARPSQTQTMGMYSAFWR